MKKLIINYRIALLMLVLIFSVGCERTDEHLKNEQEEILPDEQDNDPYAPVLNEPGPPIEPKEGKFTIAVLPDTQYYVSENHAGSAEMFESQIDWIKENQEKENIVYVIHLGDITQRGDRSIEEWNIAKDIMYQLENPVSIPYGIAVGNHDQHPSGYAVTGTTRNYNKYFGVEHFEERSYYGGNYGDNNDSHYDLFSAGGVDFIVIYIEYDINNEAQADLNNWAYNLLNSYSSRKAIVVSHYLIGNNGIAGSHNGNPGTFREQGLGIYNKLKHFPNLFMMLCGHVGDNGEGYRTDRFQGNTIRTFLSNYQSRDNGGHGIMRTYGISVEENRVEIKTFSPYTGIYETDEDSQFTTPLFD